MRRLALAALVVVLVAAGCGGGSSGSAKPTNTVIATSKAFSDAGIPFTTEVTSNPYVASQQVFLPGKLNTGDLQTHVLAMLGGSRVLAHTGWVAWVFDTDASAAAAVKEVPLAKWGASQAKVTRAVKGNVIVAAYGFTGSEKSKLDAAIAALDG